MDLFGLATVGWCLVRISMGWSVVYRNQSLVLETWEAMCTSRLAGSSLSMNRYIYSPKVPLSTHQGNIKPMRSPMHMCIGNHTIRSCGADPIGRSTKCGVSSGFYQWAGWSYLRPGLWILRHEWRDALHIIGRSPHSAGFFHSPNVPLISMNV